LINFGRKQASDDSLPRFKTGYTIDEYLEIEFRKGEWFEYYTDARQVLCFANLPDQHILTDLVLCKSKTRCASVYNGKLIPEGKLPR